MLARFGPLCPRRANENESVTTHPKSGKRGGKKEKGGRKGDLTGKPFPHAPVCCYMKRERCCGRRKGGKTRGGLRM